MRCPIPSLGSRRWPLSVGAKPPGLDIWCGVDRPSTCETESYMEKLAFTRACLFDVRVIVVIMHVPLVESLCQTTMGWIPTRVPVARHAWNLWPCPVVPSSKCHYFLRRWCLVKSTRYWKLLEATIMRKRDGADCSRVYFFLGLWPLLFS
jgi:hypothetical protein